MKATPRTLVIGLEGADPLLLEKWCASGELPNLSRLMREGGYRRLRSSTAISSGDT